MTDRGKTIMCGVLFLDIAEYSKKSVSGQISLKERFNAYLSVAIRDVPIDDRIILDTGDGAALSFLGDVGDALQVALSMRESLREGLHMEPPLLVRMGINLGPVRLVRDLNGQPNIVGDGINVAQRVMGFADPGQILVSRSYYDAVSRLSPDYASMFHYQGSRTDKHVREHEIYAIGYPGEFTGTLTLSGDASNKGDRTGLSRRLLKPWKAISAAFKDASPVVRIVYGGMLLAPVVAVIVLLAVLLRTSPLATGTMPASALPVVLPDSAPLAASHVAVVPASSVVAVVPVSGVPVTGSSGQAGLQEPRKEKQEKKKKPSEKQLQKHRESTVVVLGQPETKPSGEGSIIVSCAAGANVFIDGQPKGRAGKSPMTIKVAAGKHTIMMLLAGKSQVFSKDIFVSAGKSLSISASFCQ